MSGIGWTEFVVIALIVLVFVGPKHMPGMLKKFGRIISELRSASRELRTQIEIEMDDIPSPSRMVRDLGQEVKEDLLSPYNDVMEEAREITNEVKGTLDSSAKAPEEKPLADPYAAQKEANEEDKP